MFHGDVMDAEVTLFALAGWRRCGWCGLRMTATLLTTWDERAISRCPKCGRYKSDPGTVRGRPVGNTEFERVERLIEVER